MSGLPVIDGYGVSTAYTYGYYRQLSPTWLRLVALSRGILLPPSEGLRYFELGFGQGVSLNVHAAANLGEYWGNDYNPEHLAYARRMAEASGANLHLLGDSFEQLAERNDLPQFDVIVAHGIWSWIADSTRAAILKFIDDRLAPGGIFYVSYNALPGAASGIALQRLLHSITASLDQSLSEIERFDIARGYLRTITVEPGNHFDGYPKAKERLDRILLGASPYLLHEYTVASWRPELLCEVSAQMRQIGLEFCGSAYFDQQWIGKPTVEAGEAELVREEMLRDFRLDTMFRSDLFARPNQSMTKTALLEAVGGQPVALRIVPDEVDFSSVNLADQDLAARLKALLEVMEAHLPRLLSITEIFKLFGLQAEEEQNTSALCFALNQGLIHPAVSNIDPICRLSSAKLDAHLCAINPDAKDGQQRIAPAIGSAVPFPALDESLFPHVDKPEKIIASLQSDDRSRKGMAALEVLKYAARFKSRVKILNSLRV